MLMTFLLVYSSCTTPALQQRRMGLLDDDGQIHARVAGTVAMVRSCRGKGSNRLLVVPIELHIDCCCIGLFHLLDVVVVPGAIGNMMWHANIIDQRDTTAFADRNRCLDESLSAHMDFVTASTCARIACAVIRNATTCDEQHESGTAQYEGDS